MSFDADDNEGAISNINVTPLIDVMLVLLIVFMVSVPMQTQGIELNLPQKKVKMQKDDVLIVSINHNGRITLSDGERIGIKEVGSRIASILSMRENKSVFVKADEDVDYGTVMAVIARIHRAGNYNVGLITDENALSEEGKKDS